MDTENSASDIETLVRITPVKVLSKSMNTIAQAIDEAATDGNKQQVLKLVDSAESLLNAITQLNK
ncbi:hypothetical protein [Lentilactobacillus kisonensis]|uniref:Uncharacterized protein n=2 Tax=Lentilactobacillus kisonensis TaxID=481722 RepID=H1LHA6_9LACO|nr:hypothetical protein [Lentilactobacillus kisonensis]EHO50458.1 hypothetical protein HMPREF9104_01996 [Lentilactobacillus kisonensis F0435]KRL20266.1 hypothetical protein FC98_GL001769 [Lentilactobacillus kisonensis DSM 19906 = JCM 15041]